MAEYYNGMYDLRLYGAARAFFVIRRMAEMRVTIDLEREIIAILFVDALAICKDEWNISLVLLFLLAAQS